MFKYVTPCWSNPTPILKYFISLANRETERGKDENRNRLKCRSISTKGSDSRGQEEGTNMEATKTSGGKNASPSYNPPRDCNISSLYMC